MATREIVQDVIAESKDIEKKIRGMSSSELEAFKKQQIAAGKTQLAILADLALLGIGGGALTVGGKLVFKGLQGAKAVAAARKAMKAKNIKIKSADDVAVNKLKPKARKSGGKDTTTSPPKQKAPDPIVAKKPPPRRPALKGKAQRVDGKTPTKTNPKMTKAMREKVLANQARRQKSQTGRTRAALAAVAAGAGATGLGVTAAKLSEKKTQKQPTAAELRALRSTSKTKKVAAGGGKPGPKRGKLPGGKPGPGKKTMTAAQAAAQEAAARKKVRDEAAKKKATSSRKGPVQASDDSKQRPKRPKADQSRPRGGKVTAKRINESMKDRGKAFQGSYDPKTEVLRNVTVNGKRKTMVFKKK
tara:strand:+ start:1490 stop:2566 length:1077 start_codon:yes stop_codon:yes gene_type:complete